MTDTEELAELRQDINQIKKTLYLGNGVKPMTVRVEALEVTTADLKSDIAAIKTDIRSIKGGISKALWIVGGQILLYLCQYIPKLLALT